MKARIYIMVLLSVLLLQSCEKDPISGISDKAIENFEKMFPDAQGTEWELKQEFAVATFYMADTKTTAPSNNSAWFYNESGAWGMTETEIVYTELPEAVRAAFEASEYAAWNVEDIDLLSRQGIEKTYVIEIEKAEMELELYYNGNGLLLKIEQDDDDDDDYTDQVPGIYMSQIEDFVNKIYPGARILDVEEEEVEDSEKGEMEIQVEILDGNIEREIHFNMDVVWQYTETEMEVKNLPALVVKTIEDNYPDAEIEEASMIETSSMVYFEIELENDDEEFTVRITQDGRILK